MKIFKSGEPRAMSNRFFQRFVYILVLFAISTAAYISFTHLSPIPPPANDALEYIACAKNIADDSGFSYDGINPAVYRPPLFAAALASWFVISGDITVESMLIFQILLKSLGICVAFLLLSRFFSYNASFLGALFIALNPFIFADMVYILQEPLLLLFSTFSVWLTIIWFKDQTYSKAALVGFFWGITTLGKIVTWFVPVILWGMWLLSKLFSKLNWDLSWKNLIVISSMFILTIAPWTVRNYRHFNRLIIVNDQGSDALAWFCSMGMLNRIGGGDYVQNLKDRALPDKEFKKELFDYIISHPKNSLLQISNNFFSFTQFSREWFGHVAGLPMRWYVWIIPAMLLQLPLYIGLFTGLLYERRIEIIFLSLFYLVYWAQYSIYWGIPRYAVPVYPILVALGLNGLRYVITRKCPQNASLSDHNFSSGAHK